MTRKQLVLPRVQLAQLRAVGHPRRAVRREEAGWREQLTAKINKLVVRAIAALESWPKKPTPWLMPGTPQNLHE